jgi:rhodanese-related sulfurtransferase
MKKLLLIAIITVWFVPSAGYSDTTNRKSETGPPVSGTVIDGYRILSVDGAQEAPDLKVYRGDYIKFKFDASIQDPVLSIPTLTIRKTLPHDFAQAPYFKMKTPGTYPFSLGDVHGSITVVNFRAASYREVSASTAAELIQTEKPIILDVRTPNEYKHGHLHQSILIPVQVLQSRYKELEMYKDREILIYCATGNRSTVAAKILIDRGFKHIVNMRGGIYKWSRQNYPVAR